jgi:hypothetical protein
LEKLRWVLALYCVFLVSCSAHNTLISIREHRLDPTLTPDYLHWITRTQLSIGIGSNPSTASNFIVAFRNFTDRMPFPVVVWAGDGQRSSYGLEFPGQVWAEALQSVGSWAGPYHAQLFPGFVEIAWTSADAERRLRESMRASVPPTELRSQMAVDFLRMWYAVSGMEFSYEPELIRELFPGTRSACRTRVQLSCRKLAKLRTEYLFPGAL